MNDAWKTIDTAPKDGTLILLYDAHEKYYAHQFYTGSWGGNDERYYEQKFCSHGYRKTPTHWMLRPPPPALDIIAGAKNYLTIEQLEAIISEKKLT